jgi:hypothetical protein
MAINKSFPTHFPNCCPPHDSVDANGPIFRIVKNQTLTDDDFLSQYELNAAPTADPCNRCGVSVFDSFQNALHRQQLTPRLGVAISEGMINDTTGKMLLTNKKSGHIEWWSFEGIERKSFFGKPELCT